MDTQHIVPELTKKFQLAEDHFIQELKKIRTGRANADMLDSVLVEAYGTKMPLNQVASIAVIDAQLIQITPFDPNNLKAITIAIRDNKNLGLNPIDNGHVVRLAIPPLNEERRHEIAKNLGEKTEECMISLRNLRHEALRTLDQAKKDKNISENERARLEKQIDDIMNQFKIRIDEQNTKKENEILTL
jgi:ribosome recycling factor